MATEVASAFVSLVPSARGFGRRLDRELNTEVGGSADRAGRKFGNRFSGAATAPMRAGFAKLGAVGAAALGAAAIGKGIGDSITAASNLGETMSKVNQIFGAESVPALEKFASGAASALGQSKQQALDAAATFAVFGKSAGLQGAGLSTFSTQLTSLASDLASFQNTSPEEAITAIGAALRGENEPIRRFGVLLDDASLRAEALRQGLISTTKTALTPQQKVLAAQALILKQTTDAQGDFARTSGGLANKQRALSAQLANVRATLGQHLLPVALKVTTAFANFVTGITSGSDRINGKASSIAAFGASVRDIFINKIIPVARRFGRWFAADLWPALQTVFAAIREGMTAAAANFAKAFGAFNTDRASSGLKSFGDLITTVIIPAVAKFYSVYLPALGTAYGTAARGLYGLGQAFVDMSLAGVRAFTGLASGVMTAIGSIINAAYKVRFLFPGLGDDIADAKHGFDDFKTKTLAGLATTEAGLISVKEALANIKSKQITVDVIIAEAGERGGATKQTANAVATKRKQQAAAAKAAAAAAKKDAVDAAKRQREQQAAAAKAAAKAAADAARRENAAAKAARERAKQRAQQVIDAAKQKLTDARQQLADYAQSVADGIRSFADISSITSASGAAATPNSVQAFLRNQLATITKFQRNLKALAKRGLSKGVLQQIANAGPEQGGPVAEALVRASGKQFADISATAGRIDKTAADVGAFMGQQVYGADVKTAQQQVINVTVNNPKPERASTSAPKAVRRGLVAAGA